jgi:hypothetical protein
VLHFFEHTYIRDTLIGQPTTITKIDIDQTNKRSQMRGALVGYLVTLMQIKALQSYQCTKMRDTLVSQTTTPTYREYTQINKSSKTG